MEEPIGATRVRKEVGGSGRGPVPRYSLMISALPTATAASLRRSLGSLLSTTSPRLAAPATMGPHRRVDDVGCPGL